MNTCNSIAKQHFGDFQQNSEKNQTHSLSLSLSLSPTIKYNCSLVKNNNKLTTFDALLQFYKKNS